MRHNKTKKNNRNHSNATQTPPYYTIYRKEINFVKNLSHHPSTPYLDNWPILYILLET